MTALLNKRPARLLPVLAVVAVAVGLSGCGVAHREAKPSDVSATELANGAEPYFWSGPVTYQVQISRQLNPYDSYDVQYLAGVKGAQDLAGQQFWFAVFLWAKNQGKHTVTTSDRFLLVDSDGQKFTPTQLNASVNPYAWTAQKLSPDGIEPVADSAASDSSPGGGLILFKLNQNVYSNRPLTLEVFAKGSSKPTSKVSLDL